jgi:DNA-binding transcriptional MocR family regulator
LATGSIRSNALKLEPNDSRPLYVQIADQLADAIEDERLHPGDRLPAMRDLARELGCALVTVSQAYELLTARGRAHARVGKGTYVAEPVDRRERMEGVLVMPAEPFYPTRQGPPALRLSFGHIPSDVAKEGVRRLGAALERSN